MPSRQVEQLQKKRENGFGVFKKKDSVAQEEPWFKMQNRPETPVSSNKAVRDYHYHILKFEIFAE